MVNLGLLLSCFSLLIVMGHCAKLPVQAHGFNDLDYLANLVKRGVDYYKLDVSLAN